MDNGLIGAVLLLVGFCVYFIGILSGVAVVYLCSTVIFFISFVFSIRGAIESWREIKQLKAERIARLRDKGYVTD